MSYAFGDRDVRAQAHMTDLSLAHVEQRLAPTLGNEPKRHSKRRAAVACLLRYERVAPDVLLMKRASRDGDRWSGHVSFPGGREEPGDESLVETAVRETSEEVGVDLRSTARLLGRLDPIRAIAKGKFLPMSITPYVFVQTRPAPVHLGEEAAAAFWLPLDRVARGELATRHVHRVGLVDMTFPAWRHNGHTIWGLTFRMINDLLAALT